MGRLEIIALAALVAAVVVLCGLDGWMVAHGVDLFRP